MQHSQDGCAQCIKCTVMCSALLSFGDAHSGCQLHNLSVLLPVVCVASTRERDTEPGPCSPSLPHQPKAARLENSQHTASRSLRSKLGPQKGATLAVPWPLSHTRHHHRMKPLLVEEDATSPGQYRTLMSTVLYWAPGTQSCPLERALMAKVPPQVQCALSSLQFTPNW
jgi:hypothetical protein